MGDGIMLEENKNQEAGNPVTASYNHKELNNMLCIIAMLEKALNRLLRRNYYGQNQYPEIALQIEQSFNTLRAWIHDYKIYGCLTVFSLQLSIAIKELGEMVEQLIELCKPLPGKRAAGKKQVSKEQMNLCRSIDSMLAHIASYLDKTETHTTIIGTAMERALQKAFEEYCTKSHERRINIPLSQRGEKTYIFPWADKKKYMLIVRDKKKFRIEVVEKFNKCFHTTGHKPSCVGPKRYHLIGYRKYDRKPVMAGRAVEQFPIRMIQCVECEQKFSLLPSFLPREKHYSIDLIAHVFQNIALFSQSIQAALENTKIDGKGVKCKQTILNWLRWIGTLHPATILTRAGVQGSGYFQEDEGFEKEPNLRTYTVFMVDPKTLVVWHADYVDHVDEESLCASFEKFLHRVTFKVLGITKDKWEASTKALKATFYRIWIGFCHRHCLKKFREALSKYQEQTQSSGKEIKRLYNKFKKILNTAHSEIILKIKIKSLTDEAFRHPLLRERLSELEKNAVHYTCHKNRNGITKTTSIVDNFLKLAKRKLRMAESFRDQEYARILFLALANIRNFVPFLPGAKNAHQSPFMLAHGQTYNLPWIQVMNMHNAFLFTPNAC
jgi:hypothetical protein